MMTPMMQKKGAGKVVLISTGIRQQEKTGSGMVFQGETRRLYERAA